MKLADGNVSTFSVFTDQHSSSFQFLIQGQGSKLSGQELDLYPRCYTGFVIGHISKVSKVHIFCAKRSIFIFVFLCKVLQCRVRNHVLTVLVL